MVSSCWVLAPFPGPQAVLSGRQHHQPGFRNEANTPRQPEMYMWPKYVQLLLLRSLKNQSNEHHKKVKTEGLALEKISIRYGNLKVSRVQPFATLGTVAHPAPRSMEFFRQEHWIGCHSHLQGILSTQGWNPSLRFLHCRQLLYRRAIISNSKWYSRICKELQINKENKPS